MKDNFEEQGQYGELLWEEPEEPYDLRIRMGLYSGASLLVIGLILLTIGLEFNVDMFSYTSGLLFVSGFIILILGFGPLPIRIYETGILISNRLFGYRHFIPWTQIGQIHEVRSFTTTNTIFRTEKGGVIAINKNSPGLQETIDNINRNELIGYKIDVYNEENIITQRKLELWAYPISILGSFLIILAMIVVNFEPAFSLVSWLALIGSAVSFMSVILVGLALLELLNMRVRFSIGLKVNTGTFLVFILIMNLIFISSIAIDYVGYFEDYSTDGEFRLHSIPNDFWEGGFGLRNQTYNIDKILYVQNGSEYVISNSEVIFGSNQDTGIFVERGGHLIIENSTISTENNLTTYWFEVYGKLTVTDSVIQNLWGDPQNENMDGGIELHWAEARFERSRIQFGRTNGIMARDSSLYMSSCFIEYCMDDGIELHNTPAIIKNCEFRYNIWPIILWDRSDAMVYNCLFDANDEGLYIFESSPTIEECTFANTGSGPAITVMGWRARPVFTNNVFHNNEVDIEEPSEPSLVGCTIILPMISAILYGLLYYRNNKIEEDGV